MAAAPSSNGTSGIIGIIVALIVVGSFYINQKRKARRGLANSQVQAATPQTMSTPQAVNPPISNTASSVNNTISMAGDAWWPKNGWYNSLSFLEWLIPKGTLTIANGTLAFVIKGKVIFSEPLSNIVVQQAYLSDILQVDTPGHSYNLWLTSPKFEGYGDVKGKRLNEWKDALRSAGARVS